MIGKFIRTFWILIVLLFLMIFVREDSPYLAHFLMGIAWVVWIVIGLKEEIVNKDKKGITHSLLALFLFMTLLIIWYVYPLLFN